MFFLRVISPFLCRLHYIHTVLTPWHSAYGTWGIICQFVTGHGYFSYANFCLHGLLFLMLFGFYPQDLGYAARSAWRQVLTEDGGTMEWWHGSEMERKEEREGRQSGAEWRIEAALLEACHRLRLTSLFLTDWWDYPDIFSFQLKLHYHKDLMLGRSPYYSQGIWVPFCSLLHSVLSFFTHTLRDEIFFTGLHVLSIGTTAWIPFQRLCIIFATIYHGNAVSPVPAPPAVNQNDAGHCELRHLISQLSLHSGLLTEWTNQAMQPGGHW